MSRRGFRPGLKFMPGYFGSSYGAVVRGRQKRFTKKGSWRSARTVPVVMVPSRRRRPNLRTGGYLGTEFKFLDTQKALTNITASWAGGEFDPAANALCCPTKGTGPSNRDGDKICITGIHIRGHINLEKQIDQADAIRAQQYCICLVQDTQTNGAQLNAEDVMVATDPETASFRNIQYSGRFKILKKWRGALTYSNGFTDGANTGTVSGQGRYFEANINCRIPVSFSGDAGTVADITDNSLHIIACASTAATISCTYYSRVRFVG